MISSYVNSVPSQGTIVSNNVVIIIYFKNGQNVEKKKSSSTYYDNTPVCVRRLYNNSAFYFKVSLSGNFGVMFIDDD